MISPLTIERFNKGDERAFKEIFDEYYGLMYNYLRRFNVLREDEKRDILSVIFLSIWNYRTTLLCDITIKATLYKCAMTRSLNAIRENKSHSEGKENYLCLVTDEDEPYHEEETNSKGKSIREAIHFLPAQEVKICTLIYLEKKKIADVADELGLTVRTVKNTLYNAKKKIKEIIKNGGKRPTPDDTYAPDELTLKIHQLRIEGKSYYRIDKELKIASYGRHTTYLKHFPERLLDIPIKIGKKYKLKKINS